MPYVPSRAPSQNATVVCRESQLVSFSYQFYDKIQNDPVDFLREVYYHHVPRKNDSEGLVIDSKTDQ
jgi:hypothetical protein